MAERKQPWDAADMAAGEAGNKATRKINDVGPTGQAVAENIARLRTAKGFSTYRLSELLAELDRPIAPSAISRIESGGRKVDVDDLVAFAVALQVSPTALLLPPTIEGHVEITAAGVTKAADAWSWLLGEQPLPADLPANDDGEAWNNFQTHSRPAGRRRYLASSDDAVAGEASDRMLRLEAKRGRERSTRAEWTALVRDSPEPNDEAERAGAKVTISRAEYDQLKKWMDSVSAKHNRRPAE